jgi:hypothetical protein
MAMKNGAKQRKDDRGYNAGMAKEKKRKLTGKEQAFVDYYFVHKFNAYQAAVAAGYSEKTAYQIASQNLRKLHIQEAIQARLAEVHMSADEALTLLARSWKQPRLDITLILPKPKRSALQS